VNSQRRNSSPHVFAALGSITILTFLPLIFYCVLIVVTNDAGGPLNLVLIPCTNLIAASLFTLVFFFPLSILLERLLQKVNRNEHPKVSSFLLSGVVWVLILSLVVSGFMLVIGTILEVPLALWILGERDVESMIVLLFQFLFLGGVPFLLGGATYWFLLQASRKILSNREEWQEFSEYPKAG
jgi:hypothetical protein